MSLALSTLLSLGLAPLHHGGALAEISGIAAATAPSLTDTPAWLPSVGLDDYECRKPLKVAVVDWNELRDHLRALVEHTLDAASMKPRIEDADIAAHRKELQVSILAKAALVLLRFQEAVIECPMGAVVASMFLTCLANLPRREVSDDPLPPSFESMLKDLGGRSFHELMIRDLEMLLQIAMLHVTVATEWRVFAMLSLYVGNLIPTVELAPISQVACRGTAVAGYSSEAMLDLLQKHVSFASGRNIQGLKFLRGLDPLVTNVMKDPTEFSHSYIHACPAGAVAFATAAAMLALMSNPSLFDRFANLCFYVFQKHTQAVFEGATLWGIFHSLAKLGTFATRGYDLVWSPQELLPLPSSTAEFDTLRLDAKARDARLEAAAAGHAHVPTQQLAKFLLVAARRHATSSRADQELIVYLSAVGGLPFSDYINSFISRAIAVGLQALIIACMDSTAFSRCTTVISQMASDGHPESVYCAQAFEGHVVLVKHAFIPALLSAAVDTVWIDFDTYILRNPTDYLRKARDMPAQVLPKRSRIRFGSFLFDDADDMCSVSKICDKRMQWAYNISDRWDASEGAAENDSVEVLVTEHWDARCLNNGLFYVRGTHRPLVFFTLFLTVLYANPYTDNQNLFDSFLAHSTTDAAVPSERPLLRYALLDLERQFACAEGHMGSAEELVTFHFWSADTRTREVTPSETLESTDSPDIGTNLSSKARIRARDGTERVEKVMSSKSELFELFFGDSEGKLIAKDAYTSKAIPEDAAKFIASVRTPKPTWKGMCSVTAVGIEELVDERMLQGDQPLVDWNKATTVIDNAPNRPRTPAQDALPQSPASAAAAAAATLKDGAALGGPQCLGVPLLDWVRALQHVAALEEAAVLSTADTAAVKARLRRLDVGCLLTIQAFAPLGNQRLAAELRAVLLTAT